VCEHARLALSQKLIMLLCNTAWW